MSKLVFPIDSEPINEFMNVISEFFTTTPLI